MGKIEPRVVPPLYLEGRRLLWSVMRLMSFGHRGVRVGETEDT